MTPTLREWLLLWDLLRSSYRKRDKLKLTQQLETKSQAITKLMVRWTRLGGPRAEQSATARFLICIVPPRCRVGLLRLARAQADLKELQTAKAKLEAEAAEREQRDPREQDLRRGSLAPQDVGRCV